MINAKGETIYTNERRRTVVIRKEILEAAIRAVCIERERQYGTPENNFGRVAAFWRAYLEGRCVPQDTDIRILPEDVAMMMVLFKAARAVTGAPKADNYIDIAGYAACAAETAAEESRRV